MKQITYDEAKSLYIINKEAKRLRDLRRGTRDIIKKRLFEPDEEMDYDSLLSPEAKILLEERGITTLNAISDDAGNEFLFERDIRSSYSDHYNGREFIDTVMDFINSASLSDDDRDKIDDCFINIETDEKELRKIGLSESGIEEVLGVIAEEKSFKEGLEAVAERLNDINNKLHKFLKDGFDKVDAIKENLYNLKSAVIKISGEQPVRIDKDTNTSDYYLAYYMLNGFKFHTMISPDDVDISELDGSAEIDGISSENRLDEEEKISLIDAVKNLVNYLDLPEEYEIDILDGKETDLVSRFDLFQYTPSSSYGDVYSEYDDEDDDYYNDEDDKELSEDWYW